VNPNDVQGTWLVIVPMFQLEVSDAAPINGKWNLVTFSFVSRAPVDRDPQSADAQKHPSSRGVSEIMGDDNSFAIITLTGHAQSAPALSISSTFEKPQTFWPLPTRSMAGVMMSQDLL